ncbi:hypothetical protein M153_2080008517 [Pseudoloma neurophilia]|uniref:Uncharacterized protein n=1 Tax=Pseudoloma neurophilia TaxID=146866 RepID=A0A0R0M8B1_9MICR|nr:hypothetical protein M153_2080008517 [Pseudoloma neurophilia]
MAEKIVFVLDISEKEKNELITTNFFAGLAPHTAIYLQRENVRGVQKAKKELEKLETILFSEATSATQAQVRPTITPAKPLKTKQHPSKEQQENDAFSIQIMTTTTRTVLYRKYEKGKDYVL